MAVKPYREANPRYRWLLAGSLSDAKINLLDVGSMTGFFGEVGQNSIECFDDIRRLGTMGFESLLLQRWYVQEKAVGNLCHRVEYIDQYFFLSILEAVLTRL